MFVFLVADFPVVLPSAELWALNDRLNELFGEMAYRDDPAYFSGLEVSDSIESEDYGPGRAFSLELVPRYVDPILEALDEEFIRTWPLAEALRRAVLPCRAP